MKRILIIVLMVLIMWSVWPYVPGNIQETLITFINQIRPVETTVAIESNAFTRNDSDNPNRTACFANCDSDAYKHSTGLSGTVRRNPGDQPAAGYRNSDFGSDRNANCCTNSDIYL